MLLLVWSLSLVLLLRLLPLVVLTALATSGLVVGVWGFVLCPRRGARRFREAETTKCAFASAVRRHRCSSRSLGQAWDSSRALERTHPVRRSLSTALRIRRRCRRGKGELGFEELAGFGNIGLQFDQRRFDVNRDEWLINRVAFLKGLKSYTEPQQLLVLLADKPDRSAADNQLLAALVRLEQANDRAAQARLAATKLIQANKRQSAKAERKARAHRLIQQGVLFDLAGLESRSRGELLGLLLAAAKTEDPQRWAAWKQAGDALLAEKGDATG